MIEQKIDLWELECDVRCITTNGTVRGGNGRNIMGGGCAREAVYRFPDLDLEYGDLIRRHGHHVFLMHDGLVMFPTKETIQDNASLATVERSCRELVKLADMYGWKKVAVPRPGAGLGGLKWENVKPVCEFWLHGPRFIIVDFPR